MPLSAVRFEICSRVSSWWWSDEVDEVDEVLVELVLEVE